MKKERERFFDNRLRCLSKRILETRKNHLGTRSSAKDKNWEKRKNYWIKRLENWKKEGFEFLKTCINIASDIAIVLRLIQHHLSLLDSYSINTIAEFPSFRFRFVAPDETFLHARLRAKQNVSESNSWILFIAANSGLRENRLIIDIISVTTNSTSRWVTLVRSIAMEFVKC